MKKNIKLFYVLLILIVGVVALTGCNKSNNTNNNNSNNSDSVDPSAIRLQINSNGLGQISYYVNDLDKVDFNDEYPIQSTYVNLEKETTVILDAKADKGWKFVKWTKDGKEYSKESKLELKVSKSTEMVAYFENEEQKAE